MSEGLFQGFVHFFLSHQLRFQMYFFFFYVFFSLRDNNISDRGICKLIEHALHCEKLQKLA